MKLASVGALLLLTVVRCEGTLIVEKALHSSQEKLLGPPALLGAGTEHFEGAQHSVAAADTSDEFGSEKSELLMSDWDADDLGDDTEPEWDEAMAQSTWGEGEDDPSVEKWLQHFLSELEAAGEHPNFDEDAQTDTGLGLEADEELAADGDNGDVDTDQHCYEEMENDDML